MSQDKLVLSPTKQSINDFGKSSLVNMYKYWFYLNHLHIYLYHVFDIYGWGYLDDEDKVK